MSSGRTLCIPKEYSQPLQELGWSSHRIATTFLELIDVIFYSLQGSTEFIGREAFTFSSVNQQQVDHFIHNTFGSEISITMQLIHDRDVFWVNHFQWR